MNGLLTLLKSRVTPIRPVREIVSRATRGAVSFQAFAQKIGVP